MKIAWLISDIEHKDGQLKSSLASVRFRCLSIIDELEKKNPEIDHMIVLLNHHLEHNLEQAKDCDIIIIGKVMQADIGKYLYDELPKLNKPIVLDLCDNVFLDKRRFYYELLIAIADKVIFASDKLKEAVTNGFPKISEVIKDPTTLPIVEPKVIIDNNHQLCWFGLSNNLDNIVKFMYPILKQNESDNFNLEIVTDTWNINKNFITEKLALPNIKITYTPWCEYAEEQAIINSDAVIIPVDNKNKSKQVKTANRVITAISLGKPVITQPIDSYQEFKESIFMHEDPALAWSAYVMTDEKTVELKVKLGQAIIKKFFTLERISKQYLNLFKKQLQKKPEPEIKLNLGCGGRILDGYINVDVVDERFNQTPDIVCDITNLDQISDDYADLILSVHVVEHFYYWDIHKVLTEWHRVLKPGGKIIIECPSLVKCCRNILADTQNQAQPNDSGRMGVLGVFGDPRYDDPLMCHKWLYTPATLALELVKAGFVEINQKNAQFHMKDYRDMRIEAIKP